MNNKQSVALWCLFLTVVVFLYKDRTDMKEALDSCIASVQKECGPVIEYASLLESENARINKKIRAYKILQG